MALKKESKTIKTWRTIRQSRFAPSATELGIRRKYMRTLRGILKAIGCVVVGVVFIWVFFDFHQVKDTIPKPIIIKGLPIDNIRVRTDGTIGKELIERHLMLPSDTSLLELDIHQLHKKLEAISQIKTVNITKIFPTTLLIEIQEYQPLVRVAIKNVNKDIRLLLVSQEGIIYSPMPGSYPDDFLKKLPWIEGVMIYEVNKKLAPLPGMVILADLLKQAKKEKPHIYALFNTIGCSSFDIKPNTPWSVISIKTKKLGTIVFAPSHFLEQLERLDYILNELKDTTRSINKIDLSLGDQAVVSFFDDKKRK